MHLVETDDQRTGTDRPSLATPVDDLRLLSPSSFQQNAPANRGTESRYSADYFAKDRALPRFGIVASYGRDSNFYIQMARRLRKHPATSSALVSSIQTFEDGIRRGIRMEGKEWIRTFGLRRYPAILPDVDRRKARHPRRVFNLDSDESGVFADVVPSGCDGSRGSAGLLTSSQSTSSLQDVANGNAAATATVPGKDQLRLRCDRIRRKMPIADGDDVTTGNAQPLGDAGDIFRRTTVAEKRKISPEEPSALYLNDNMDTAL